MLSLVENLDQELIKFNHLRLNLFKLLSSIIITKALQSGSLYLLEPLIEWNVFVYVHHYTLTASGLQVICNCSLIV